MDEAAQDEAWQSGGTDVSAGRGARPPWVVPAVSFVVAALLAGLAAFLIGGGENGVATDTTTTTTTIAASPSTVAPAESSPPAAPAAAPTTAPVPQSEPTIVLRSTGLEVVDGSGAPVESLPYTTPSAALVARLTDFFGAEPAMSEETVGLTYTTARWGGFWVTYEAGDPSGGPGLRAGLDAPTARVTGPSGIVPGWTRDQALAVAPGAVSSNDVGAQPEWSDEGLLVEHPGGAPASSPGVIAVIAGGTVEALVAPRPLIAQAG